MESEFNAGGHATALMQRKRALDRYNMNPKVCKECLQPISVRPLEKIREVRKRVFCDRSCAASFNNRNAVRKHGPSRKSRVCRFCQAPHYESGMFCTQECRSASKLAKLGSRTKRELFANCASWQAARSTIQRNARQVLLKAFPFPACFCGYTTHIEVAHVVPVADFPDSALISEINHPGNLWPLCPNHHWEYDNGLIQIVAQP